jgi:hypothetical protein
MKHFVTEWALNDAQLQQLQQFLEGEGEPMAVPTTQV